MLEIGSELPNEPKVDFFPKIESLSREYGIGKRSDWDLEIAVQAVAALHEEEREKNPEEVRFLLLQRFIDAFYPPQEYSRSRLWNEMVTAPVELFDFQLNLLNDAARSDLVREVDANEKQIISRPQNRDLLVKLYGADVLVNIAHAGLWVRVPAKKVRAVASPGFSCCQAILGKSQTGDLCMAHIPGPGTWAAQEHTKGLLKKFGSGQYFLVAPECSYLPGTAKQIVTMAEETNQAFKKIAEQNGLCFLSYPEIFPGEQSSQPDLWQEFEMILTADGLQVRQAELESYENSPTNIWLGGERTVYHRKLAEKSLHDISF
ncbi:MAG: hypothetical protein V1664_00330 [Candidatus Uhrbacteria bacterium]